MDLRLDYRSSRSRARAPGRAVPLILVLAFSTPTAGPAQRSQAMRLDWDSSQIFFQHGFVERNPRYTASGLPNDVALSHAGGDAHDYSPTRPARLMSVSSMSSMVDIARAEAW